MRQYDTKRLLLPNCVPCFLCVLCFALFVKRCVCQYLMKTWLDRNRIIHGWYMEIKLFSKWRPSTILNFRKLQFWSRDLYLHVILYFRSKFRINRPLWRRDIAKKTIFNMASVRHLEFEINFLFFLKCSSWDSEYASAYQICSKSCP